MIQDPFALPQSLILAPDHDFNAVRAVFLRMGFEETTKGVRLVTEAPKSSQFVHPSGLPTALYTNHAPTGLGMLHLASVPPVLRAHLAEALAWVRPHTLVQMLDSADPKEQLFGLWAAREDERVELIPNIQRLMTKGAGQVAKEAAKIADELSNIGQIQLQTLAATQLIASSAEALIAELQNADALSSYLATPADCEALFEPQIAGAVADALAQHRWPRSGIDGVPGGVEDIFAGPAGLLRWPNSVSERFPRGYRSIAGWLTPSRIWMGWTSSLAGGGQVRFDGLVYADGHWVFFPKPWRLIGPLLPEFGPTPPARVH